jgi:glycerophosphoryl diester phosphodiesterase
MTLPRAFLETPIAHRGLHDAGVSRPENSIAAMRAAVAAGYGIEMDIQAAADGTPMVFHDATLDRMTDASGPLIERDATELGAVRLNRGTEGIPALAAVLAEVGARVPLLIEIKEQSRVMGPVDGALERAVAETLAGYGGPVAVMSFNPHSVAAFGIAAPDIPRGLVTGSFRHPAWAPLGAARLGQLRAIAEFDRVGASFISHNKDDLKNTAIAALKGRNVPVLSWTITSDAQAQEARSIADNITFEGFFP